jgi:two-component system, NtrC family, sensor histidine kinase HydH
MLMGEAVEERDQAATATRQTVFELVHEIRNPLAGIQGVADTFLQRGQLTRQEREWMEAVRREVSKIEARLREMLTASQSRACVVKQCSLSELISNVVLLALHQAKSISEREERQLDIKFIDTTKEPVIVYLDPSRIEDAVLNLVLNAIEAIEGDGRVTIRLRQVSGEALIEVTDTGCGIPLENRSRIFDALFTTKSDGTGLGLAAVRRTAAAYHGRITFKTRSGRGSKFVLALPLESQHHLTENPR